MELSRSSVPYTDRRRQRLMGFPAACRNGKRRGFRARLIADGGEGLNRGELYNPELEFPGRFKSSCLISLSKTEASVSPTWRA